jgi:mevalonate kinase
MVHTKSSGVDPFAVATGGITFYQKGNIRKLDVDEYPHLIVAHSGETSDTGDIVSDLDSMASGPTFKRFLEESEKIVFRGTGAVEKGDWEELGKQMDANHGWLARIGVSNDKLDKMVRAARDSGALGAKLSGAGRGGIMLALADENTEKGVIKALSSLGGKIIRTNITEEGVRLE